MMSRVTQESSPRSEAWPAWGLLRRSIAPALLSACLTSGPALAHDVTNPVKIPLEGRKLIIKTDAAKPQRNAVVLSVRKQLLPNTDNHDPILEGFEVLVRSGDPNGQRTPLITLDPAAWKIKGNPGKRKLLYLDKTQSRGGIKKVIIKNGSVKLVARGQNWPWNISGGQGSVWVHLYLGDEEFCLEFGGDIRKNEVGRFYARDAPAMVSCPDAVCGNGRPFWA